MQWPDTFVHGRVVWRSHKPVRETTAPLWLTRGVLYTRALVDGRQTVCVLDTGNTISEWPNTLPLNYAPVAVTIKTKSVAGPPYQEQLVRVRSVRFGAYEIRNVPFGRAPSRNVPVPVIGAELLNRAVVTLDLRAGVMVIRSSIAARTRLARSPRDTEVPFTWMGQYVGLRKPMMQAFVDGHAARTLFDTRCAGFVLTRRFCDKYFARRVRSDTGKTVGPNSGPFHKVDVVPGCSVKIGGVAARQRAWVLPLAADLYDSLLGLALLRSYRITVDFPRRRILFQPY